MGRKFELLSRFLRVKNMKNPSDRDLYLTHLDVREIVKINIEEFVKKTYGLSMEDYVKSVVNRIGEILENEYQPLVAAKNNKAPSDFTQNSIYIDVAGWSGKINTYRIKGGYYVDPNNTDLTLVRKGGRFYFSGSSITEPERFFNKETAEKINDAMSLLKEYPGSRWYFEVDRAYSRTCEDSNGVWYGFDGLAYSENPIVKKWIY